MNIEKPRAAYLIFCKEMFDKALEKDPDNEIGLKEMANAWKSLSEEEKNIYRQRANNEMIIYKQKIADSNYRKPESAYLLWCKDKKVEILEKDPNHKFTAKDFSDTWIALPIETKTIYKNLADDKLAAYHAVHPIIDNSELLRYYIEKGLLEQKGNFFPFIIMQRSKDGHPRTKVIKRMQLNSMDDYDKIVESIKIISEENNARCYVKVNVRNSSKISEELVKYVVTKHFEGNYHLMDKAYDHVVGVTNCSKNKRFHIDIDDLSIESDVMNKLEAVYKLYSENGADKMSNIVRVPTVSGCHLLVSPFNTNALTAHFKDLVVNNDAETLFYYNTDTN